MVAGGSDLVETDVALVELAQDVVVLVLAHRQVAVVLGVHQNHRHLGHLRTGVSDILFDSMIFSKLVAPYCYCANPILPLLVKIQSYYG